MEENVLYRPSMTLNPKIGAAVIILSNISEGHSKASLIDQLSFDLLSTVDGISLEKNLDDTDG